MQRDIRGTALYLEAELLYRENRHPGDGKVSDASGIHVSPDGRRAAYAGTCVESMAAAPPTRIFEIDIASGETRALTSGPNSDRNARYSPDGRSLAFLSDRKKIGDFQLYILDRERGETNGPLAVPGWVEYVHWSADGRRLLLGVAGHGADVSGGQGAVTSKRIFDEYPSWMPTVDSGVDNAHWRRLWIHDLTSKQTWRIESTDLNIWEANWCGSHTVVAVVSPNPDEGAWYASSLRIFDVGAGPSRELFQPRFQLGWPTASPSGAHVAVVEALCSDRWLVAGDLKIIDVDTNGVQCVDTNGVDVMHVEWLSNSALLLAGVRKEETVVCLYNLSTRLLSEKWASKELSTGGYCVAVSSLGSDGDFALIGEGFKRPPEVAIVRGGEYTSLRSLALSLVDSDSICTVQTVEWKAPDGLQIQGWLLTPVCGEQPFPLVTCIHGGPVWHWRPSWIGRSLSWTMLLKRGYALFLPNPRGSSGRGQAFVQHVLGDMGGADASDHLSGLDHLISCGFADPLRIAVTGGSYGGFMTSWLVTQDSRFAAAIPVAPVTNHVTEHLISNIPHFVRMFLADTYTNSGGKYFTRSPIMYTQNVGTPTLNICGALDRCTPAEEALQFHSALLEAGKKSVLVIYPEEGHGIRNLPSSIDCAARIVGWIEEHMPACTSSMRRLSTE